MIVKFIAEEINKAECKDLIGNYEECHKIHKKCKKGCCEECIKEKRT